MNELIEVLRRVVDEIKALRYAVEDLVEYDDEEEFYLYDDVDGYYEEDFYND